MFLLLILLVIFTYIVLYRIKKKKLIEFSNIFPSKMLALPLIGHAYFFSGSDEGNMNAFKKAGNIALMRGGLATFWFANKLYLVVADPIANEVLMKNCLEKDSVSKFFQFLMGNGSIFAPVPTWRPRRKHMIPSFSKKRLNRFVDVFQKRSVLMVEQLQPSVGQGTISMWKYLTTYTFASLCETTFGIQDLGPEFAEAFENLAELMARRMLQPWLHPEWLYRLLPYYRQAKKYRKLIFDFVDNLIKLKREEMETKGPDYLPEADSDLGFKCLLEILLESSLKGKGFNDLELREETVTMCVAGIDTSAVAACFTLVLLSRYPEIQKKVVEELNEVLEYGDKPVTAVDLPKLKYMDAVLKETLRLYPPVPVLSRAATSDTELRFGVIIPKGTGLIFNIWAIHRNPRYWGPDADVFKPERFFEPLKHPAQFSPFSYGPRNCIGYQYGMMSIKILLATFLRHYQVLPPVGADPKTLKEPLRVTYEMMMKTVDKFQLQIEPRTPGRTRKVG